MSGLRVSGPRLSARDRRALAVGVASIGALIALSRGLPPLVRWQQERRASAQELARELARAETSIARMQRDRDSLAARNARYLALAPMLLPERTGAASTAALAAMVSGAGAGAGVAMGAVQPLPDTVRGVFRQVGVRADATGDVRGVAKLLEALERGPTRLAIRRLTIAQPAPGAPATQPEALHLQLDVYGLALGDAAGRRP